MMRSFSAIMSADPPPVSSLQPFSPAALEALGPEFATSPRAVLKALREGRPIPGSAVILL